MFTAYSPQDMFSHGMFTACLLHGLFTAYSQENIYQTAFYFFCTFFFIFEHYNLKLEEIRDAKVTKYVPGHPHDYCCHYLSTLKSFLAVY